MMIKKIIALCLSACMISGCMTGFALAATNEDKDYTLGDVWWDVDEGKAMARWDEPESNTSYKVQLFKGSTKKGSAKSTSTEHYDFSSVIKSEGSGTYYFTVYPSKGGKDLLVQSDTITVNSSEDADISLSDLKSTSNNTSSGSSASSSQSANGGPGASSSSSTSLPSTGSQGWNQVSDGRWWYKETTNSPAISKWLLVNNLWYYFGSDGYMLTGWFQDTDGKWYYLNPTNGDMMTNTTIDGYVIGADGVWVQ